MGATAQPGFEANLIALRYGNCSMAILMLTQIEQRVFGQGLDFGMCEAA
jgi:hypothetical protein